MKISVIIPTYNTGNVLEKCLNSILNQTYKNLEIFLINDGSSDNITNKICYDFSLKDSRIKYMNNSNHGVSYSRNLGLELATGDYITFVDADDYLEEDCFESMIGYLEKNYDFVRYNLNKIEGKNFDNLHELSDSVINLNDENKDNLIRHFLTYDQNIPCFVWLLFIRNDISKKIKFNEKLTIMEDTDFYLQLFNNSKKCAFYDNKKYNYYINPSSVMHNPEFYKKNIFGIIDTNYSIFNQINQMKISNDVKKMINGQHLKLIYSFLMQLYNSNKEEYRNAVEVLLQNERYKYIANLYKGLNLKNKIFHFLIKSKFYLLQYSFLNIIKILKKIIKKND